jgi:prevent-host-death family protein
MSETSTGPARVGVRELRQNLSVYLDRVKEGEILEVTEHGHAVALLTPLPRSTMSTLDRLIAEGRVTPGSGDLMAYLRSHQPARMATATATAPRPAATATEHDTGPTMAEILRQMQDEGAR